MRVLCWGRDGSLARARAEGFEAAASREGFFASADHPLLSMENVLCTPHLGYTDSRGYETMYGHAVDQLRAYAAGSPINVVSTEAGGKR